MSFWQSLILVLIGVLISAASYLAKNFIFEPLREYNACRGKIRNRLKYYANIITSPGANEELSRESSKVCRELSCELEEKYYSISFLKWLTKMKLIQPASNVQLAAQKLIFLSNSTFNGKPMHNHEALEEISSKLWFGQTI